MGVLFKELAQHKLHASEDCRISEKMRLEIETHVDKEMMSEYNHWRIHAQEGCEI